MHIRGIDATYYTVLDLKTVAAFYSKILGEPTTSLEGRLAEWTLPDDNAFGLYGTPAKPANRSGSVMFAVDDLDDAVRDSSAFENLRFGSARLGVEAAAIDGRTIRIRERTLFDKPFGRLVHFEVERAPAPPILVVAPLSGMSWHVLYDLVLGALPHFDVHVLGWSDAGDVPVQVGPFDLDDNIAYVVDAARHLGAGFHLVGLCQSALPVLAAASILAAAGDPAEPESLVLIGGKLDTRIRPTRIDRLTRSRSLEEIERDLVTIVPAPRHGRGRRVYSAATKWLMVATYLTRQLASGGELLAKMVLDDGVDPVGHPFIELFFSLADLPAEFFLDTVARVFHESELPRGVMAWRGARVAPAKISRAALLTIEGERDDISAPGQTCAAHELCAGIRSTRKAHFLCPDVGHFGLFHGAAFRREVLPRIRSFIREVAVA